MENSSGIDISKLTLKDVKVEFSKDVNRQAPLKNVNTSASHKVPSYTIEKNNIVKTPVYNSNNKISNIIVDSSKKSISSTTNHVKGKLSNKENNLNFIECKDGVRNIKASEKTSKPKHNNKSSSSNYNISSPSKNNINSNKKTISNNRIPDIPITKSIKKIYDGDTKYYNQYKVLSVIGVGSYSKVKLVYDLNKEKYFCFKIISELSLTRKKKFFGKDEEGNIVIQTLFDDAKNEMDILQKINNPYICNLHEILIDEENKKYYLVLDYIKHGAIMTYLDKEEKFVINKVLLNSNNNNSNDSNDSSNNTLISEKHIKNIIYNTTKAINYLHSNNIVHRDIKVDNILLDENLNPRLSDFSIASLIKGDDVFKKTEGNLYFYSPELCQGLKTFSAKPCDIWALGVCAYLMVYHELPIFPKNRNNTIELLALIKEGSVDYNKNKNVNSYSKKLISVIERCLTKDPLKRITAKELLELDYFKDISL